MTAADRPGGSGVAAAGASAPRRRRALAGYTFRVPEVVRTETVTPLMRRIVLGGPDLAGFGTDRQGPNVKIYVPRPGQSRPRLPEPDGRGGLWWPPADELPTMRTYTVRAFDPATNELTIDFALHGGGIAGDWAARAEPGDTLGITGPGGARFRRADWNLLVADHAGLPAASVILERLAEDAPDAVGLALLQVPDPADEQPVAHPPGVELRWLGPDDPATPGARLAGAIRALDWPADGSTFSWIAAESRIVRDARRYVREERALGRGHDLSIGYWRRGMTESEYDKAFRNDRDDHQH